MKVLERMKELIATHKSWGYTIIHEVLKREGLVKNPKKTWCIYKENNLTLKQRKRHKRASMLRLDLPEASRPNERWAMDFVSDGLWNGRKFKALAAVDIFTKAALKSLLPIAALNLQEEPLTNGHITTTSGVEVQRPVDTKRLIMCRRITPTPAEGRRY